MAKSNNRPIKTKKTASKNTMNIMVKEAMLNLLESGDPEFMQALVGALSEDVREFVEESVSRKVAMIKESIQPIHNLDNSKPKDTVMWDCLVEVASGDKPSYIHEGKRVSIPAKGVGYQTPDKIKNWSSKMYTKLGGEWIPKGFAQGTNMNDGLTIPYATRSPNQTFSDSAIDNIAGQFREVDEHGEIIPGKFVQEDIMAQILRETKENPIGSNRGLQQDEIASKQLSASNPLEHLFSSDATDESKTGSWSDLAFFDEK